MKKPTNLGKLASNQYRLIADEAGVSKQTVEKWFADSLSVRPSTEQKIISAWIRISSSLSAEIDKRVHDNKVVIARIEAMNNVLEAQKKVIDDRLSIIIEL